MVPFVLLATETVSEASPHSCAVQPIRPHSAPTIWLSKTVDHVPFARNAGQRAARHVAVVVEIATQVDGREVHCADARHTIRSKWTRDLD